MNTPSGHLVANLPDRRALAVGFGRVALGVGMTDLKTLFTDANPALCEFYGRPMDEVIGHSPYEFMDPDDAEVAAPLVADLLSGARPSCVFEGRAAHPDGTVVWGRFSLWMVR